MLEIAKTEDFEAELTNILEQSCQAEGWKYAEVWVPDGRVLRCHASHYMASEQLAVFRNESEEFTFTAGSGLPGRVWMLETPEWIENVTLEPAIYYRSDIAKKVGLKAALGVPILAKGEVIAVLAFYRDEAQPPNESLIAECCDRIQSLIAP
jgi:signal transduction protein with GAF and PtsI domain